MAANTPLYISNLRSNPSYSKYKSYHWADYIELLCLANIDNEISKADLIDRLSERAADLGEGDIDEIEEMEGLEKEGNQMATKRSSKADIWDERIEDLFRLIEHRISIYGDYYPFILEQNTLRLKVEQLENPQLTYSYLLFCSNLYLFDKGDQLELANNFELLCLQVLKNILPTNAIVELFGKNPSNKEGYVGPLWNKINLLAKALNEQIHPLLPQENYPPQNTGDDGLDLVGYIPSGDSLPSKLAFFGQCACTTDWVSKQHSSSYDAWKTKITITTSTNNLIFMPFCFRAASGNWASIGDIHNSLLIDRKRIIFYLRENFKSFEDLPSYNLVNNFILAKEGVF